MIILDNIILRLRKLGIVDEVIGTNVCNPIVQYCHFNKTNQMIKIWNHCQLVVTQTQLQRKNYGM